MDKRIVDVKGNVVTPPRNKRFDINKELTPFRKAMGLPQDLQWNGTWLYGDINIEFDILNGVPKITYNRYAIVRRDAMRGFTLDTWKCVSLLSTKFPGFAFLWNDDKFDVEGCKKLLKEYADSIFVSADKEHEGVFRTISKPLACCEHLPKEYFEEQLSYLTELKFYDLFKHPEEAEKLDITIDRTLREEQEWANIHGGY